MHSCGAHLHLTRHKHRLWIVWIFHHPWKPPAAKGACLPEKNVSGGTLHTMINWLKAHKSACTSAFFKVKQRINDSCLIVSCWSGYYRSSCWGRQGDRAAAGDRTHGYDCRIKTGATARDPWLNTGTGSCPSRQSRKRGSSGISRAERGSLSRWSYQSSLECKLVIRM